MIFLKLIMPSEDQFNQDEQFKRRKKEGSRLEDFGLTDRPLDDYLSFLHLNLEDLKNKKILDLGSGKYQKFARQLKEKFNDTEIVCLDISLVFKTRRIDKQLHYQQQKQPLPLLAGEFVDLPFKNDSFDYVLSLYSLSYLKTFEAYVSALAEILRVVKPGGRVHIFPLRLPPPKEIYSSLTQKFYELFQNKNLPGYKICEELINDLGKVRFLHYDRKENQYNPFSYVETGLVIFEKL